jgi:serine/threonine protein kinase/Flp pilus assembly protein TadD
MVEEPKNEEAIFNAAIQIEGCKEREAYLAEACGGDEKLRADVKALLKAHDAEGSFLESPPPGIDSTLDAGPLTEAPGMSIGRYKLLQMIGEGGFGVVYMAEQQEPIVRKVALKIIKLGMDTKQVIARFEAERQALAMMDHPNIARVLDAGATDTGRPYFVMELIKGIPVTEYCDQNNLDTHQRLELFIDVCKAVQHAHQKGIIHRDIKPSNVMITLHDGKPVPKIIDFGIAKATQQRLTEKTLFTEYRQFIGTPQYMSPEQAEMSGLDVDTRTDIYSLGVLLYELLTGTTPFEADRLRSVPYDEICRIIRQDEPPKPSTRLSTLGEALTDTARHRNVQPGELCKIVRGDLDWVVMKTLEKDRTRRYETANELAMDIQRHLGHEPVLASPPSTIYRARKFVRRHRTGVAAGLSLAASLVIGLLLAMTGFVQASHERDRTQQARERAESNFQMAREAVDEMTQVAQDDLVNIPQSEKVRQDLLESAQTLYLKFLQAKSDDPAVRQETGGAYYRLGTIQNTLGQYEQAAASFEQAIHFFNLLAADYPDVPDHRMMIALSNNSLGLALEKLGRYTEVQDAYQTASGLLTVLVGEFPDEARYREALAETYNNQGLILNSIGQVDQAQQVFEDALEIREKLAAQFPDNPKYRHDLANSCHNRGIVLEAQIGSAHIDASQWYPEVERTYRQAMELEQLLVNDYPQVHEYRHQLASIQLSLSNLLWCMVRPDEAEEVVRDGLPFAQRLADDFPGIPEYQITLVEMSHRLSTLLGQIDYAGAPFADDDPAMDTVLKARQCYEKLVSDSPTVHSYHAGLAKTFAYLSFWSSPEYPSMLEEAIRHQQTAVRLNPMNTMYRWMLVEWCEGFFWNSRDFGRRLDIVEQILEQNIALFEQLRKDIPACGRELAASLVNLGNLLEYTGRHEEAQSVYQRAEDVRLELVAQFPNLPFEGRIGNVGNSADYKVRINSAGDYRLYIRAAAYDWASDSVLARIDELADGPGGTIADYYYYDFQERSDCKFGLWSTPTEFEDSHLYLTVDTWPISTPGDYTLRLIRREDGVAVDAFVFQSADLPHPQGDGPPESVITEDGVFLESDGRVVVEAEHFAQRIPHHNKWVIIPQEDPNASTSLCLFGNYRGQGYIQVLPDRNVMDDIQRLTHILENHPQDVSALIQRGNTYWHIEEYDKAVADYLEAVRLDPNHPEIRWPISNLGDLYLRRGDYSRAEQAFRQAEKLFEDLAAGYPDLPSYRDSLAYMKVQLGILFSRTGRAEEAEQAYRQGIEIQEKLVADFPAVAWYRSSLAHKRNALTDLLKNTGRLEEAEQNIRLTIELFEELAADFPTEPDYRWNEAYEYGVFLADVLIQSENDRLQEAEQVLLHAQELFEDLVADYPDVAAYQNGLAFNYIRLGDILSKTGRLQEAEQAEQKALLVYANTIETNPDNAEAYAGHGAIYLKMKQWHEVIADYSKAIELKPEEWWYWHERGFAYMQLKQWDKVVADYTEAISLNGDNWGSYDRRAQAYQALGQFDRAICDFTKAIQLNEKLVADFPNVNDHQNDLSYNYTQLGNVLRKSGRLEEAEQADKKALEIRQVMVGDDPENLNGLAWLLATSQTADLRNGAKAIEYATKVCELTEWKEANFIDTLAAAYAEAGDFDSAVKWQKQVLNLLTEKQPAGWRGEFEARLKLYQSGRPYREGQ